MLFQIQLVKQKQAYILQTHYNFTSVFGTLLLVQIQLQKCDRLLQVNEPQTTEWNITVWSVDGKLTQHNSSMKILLTVHGRFTHTTTHVSLCSHLQFTGLSIHISTLMW